MSAPRKPQLVAAQPRVPRWVLWLPVLLLVLDLIAEAVVPDAVAAGFLLTALPVVAAFSYGPVLTAATTGGSLALQVLLALHAGHINEQHHVWVYIATLLSGAMGTALSWRRTRQNRNLLQARTVAETLQRTVLRPVPERAGGLRVAGLYRPAQAEVLVGGDLYEVCDTRFGVRALLGDVRGKGLGAVPVRRPARRRPRRPRPHPGTGPGGVALSGPAHSHRSAHSTACSRVSSSEWWVCGGSMPPCGAAHLRRKRRRGRGHGVRAPAGWVLLTGRSTARTRAGGGGGRSGRSRWCA
ncbi:hypothetical protein ABZW30_33675 [Kitasatospora sp. NPDC004669]|uniref:hypothetical protein n=1 Tax=Kitasatospora sp. NPDC004669 TaxID=3154555 RepID=UPI0033B693FF